MASPFDGQVVLITGGTGTLGHALVRHLLRQAPAKVIILSRDELKQAEMRRRFPDSRLRFFIGDVRDRDRLMQAFGAVDIVIHAAALKRVDAVEYNPFEAIATNIIGTRNVIEAAIDRCVERVLFISSDKACAAVNTYGKTKALAEALTVQANAYGRKSGTRLGVVRYGNVAGSRGSVLPLFRAQAAAGEICITDERMTRFWLPIQRAVWLVEYALREMRGGEIFVPKIPSIRVVDLAEAVAPGVPRRVTGIRAGEKLGELLIVPEEARLTVDTGAVYVTQPAHPWWQVDQPCGALVPEGWSYASDTNAEWLTVEQLREMAAQAEGDGAT